MKTALPAFLAFVFVGAATRQVHAAGSDVALAEVLFDEGKRRMAQHDYAGACPKLAESQRLAPAVGTEFNLADCWEHVGRLASSWAAFLDVADQTHQRGELEREQAARQRANALEPRLGRLVIQVPVAQRIADLQVRRDGEVVRDALWGIGLPVDAGDHALEARAPHRRAWSTVVQIRDGQSTEVTVPDLAPAPPPQESATESPPPLHSTTAPSPVPAPSADHTAAFLVLGGAVVLAGVGVVGLAEHEANIGDYNADPTCPPISASSRPAHCSAYVSSASTWNTVAVVGFVAAGVALAGGLTLWFTAPRPGASGAATSTALQCFAGLGSLGCAGRF